MYAALEDTKSYFLQHCHPADYFFWMPVISSCWRRRLQSARCGMQLIRSCQHVHRWSRCSRGTLSPKSTLTLTPCRRRRDGRNKRSLPRPRSFRCPRLHGRKPEAVFRNLGIFHYPRKDDRYERLQSEQARADNAYVGFDSRPDDRPDPGDDVVPFIRCREYSSEACQTRYADAETEREDQE